MAESITERLNRIRAQARRGAVVTSPGPGDMGAEATAPASIAQTPAASAPSNRAAVDDFIAAVMNDTGAAASNGLRPAPRPGVFTSGQPAVAAPKPVSPAERARRMAVARAPEPLGEEGAPSVTPSVAAAATGASTSGSDSPAGTGASPAPTRENAPSVTSPVQRARQLAASQQQERNERKNLAALRSLSRLMEAVFSRPGSRASEDERIAALQKLAQQANVLGTRVAQAFGENANSQFVKAHAVESMVGMVGQAWEQELDIDLERLVEKASSDGSLVALANEMASAGYLEVDSPASMSERVGISLHQAYWKVYLLGDEIDGVSTDIARDVVRHIGTYLQNRPREMGNNDLHTAWMQSAINRITTLFCAEMRAQHADMPLDESSLADALNTAITGFEGIEIYAQYLLNNPIEGAAGQRPDAVPGDA